MNKIYLILNIIAITIIISPTIVGSYNNWKYNNYSDPLKFNFVNEIKDEKWTYETYNIVKDFFSGCYTIKQFYKRINNNIADAQKDIFINPFIRTSTDINDIASVLNKHFNQLNCQQQCILLLAGIKVRYSHVFFYPYLSFKPKYDFDLVIFTSKHNEDIFPLHTQLFVMRWKGIPRFKEVDPWDDYFGFFFPINVYKESRLYS